MAKSPTWLSPPTPTATPARLPKLSVVRGCWELFPGRGRDSAPRARDGPYPGGSLPRLKGMATCCGPCLPQCPSGFLVREPLPESTAFSFRTRERVVGDARGACVSGEGGRCSTQLCFILFLKLSPLCPFSDLPPGLMGTFCFVPQVHPRCLSEAPFGSRGDGGFVASVSGPSGESV